MKETNINDIERVNVFVLILGSILILLITREFKYFFSFTVASAMMTLNFRFLKKIIEGGFGQPAVRKKDLLIKLPLKFLVLIGLVVLIVVYGDINVICFLIGLSTIFISVVVNQIQIAFTPVAKRRQN
ncbi:MAG TPA: ATP synthase subunit I [Syntrophorhabdaceae bacterium]|nr:ATP synthase subunit I [Syntrophorhabdaceae bacterium]HQM82889.1 ATP synthase subunit I [Syntrophorhabdaceae bacterium]